MNDIENYIIKGYKNGYFDNVYLNTGGGDFQSEAIEYVFTVSTAKELLKWRYDSNGGNNHSIIFELSANLFKNYCFVEWRGSNSTDSVKGIVHRQKHKAIRNKTGRIDIAILSSETPIKDRRSVVGVEVKGINPSKNSVEADIKRLVDCLIAKDPIGTNSLESCFVVFGHRIDLPKKLFNIENYENRLQSYKVELEKFISTIPCLSAVQCSISVFDIDKVTTEEFLKYNQDEDGRVDYLEAVKGTGAIAGVLLTIKRKSDDTL